MALTDQMDMMELLELMELTGKLNEDRTSQLIWRERAQPVMSINYGQVLAERLARTPDLEETQVQVVKEDTQEK